MKKQYLSCPICDSGDYSLKYKAWVDVSDPKLLYGAASGIAGTQDIVACNNCSLLYENPRYDESVILQGYMESDEEGHDSQYPMRVKSFLNALKKNKAFIPAAGSKVLDIGTAGGAFLDAAKEYGYDAWGMEPSAYLVEQGKNRGLQIEQGTIEDNQFEKNSFDMICLWDVIEHLTDPKGSLRIIRDLLKPDGVLLINYPDIDTWQARLFGKRFWWIISVHLTHFSPKTITEICNLTGYETVRFKPYFQTLEFGYLADMAVHLNVPLAKLGRGLLPGFVKRIPIPYYASQTTSIARLK
jgi:SAM-dependent methyltransferase